MVSLRRGVQGLLVLALVFAFAPGARADDAPVQVIDIPYPDPSTVAGSGDTVVLGGDGLRFLELVDGVWTLGAWVPGSGDTVRISGDWVAAATTYHAHIDGHVELTHFDGASWTPHSVLAEGNPRGIALDGRFLAVETPGSSGTQGTVRTYELAGDTWVPLGALPPVGDAPGFGADPVFFGGLLIVSDGDTVAPTLIAYRHDESGWVVDRTIPGLRAVVSDDTMAVITTNGVNAVHDTGSSWIVESSLPFETNRWDFVAIEHDVLVIGVGVFRRVGSEWSPEATLDTGAPPSGTPLVSLISSEFAFQERYGKVYVWDLAPRCQGLDPTISGTTGTDVLVGTAGADVIFGSGGDDAINGGGGDDVICGGPGNDTIDPGADNDVVDAGSGDDTVLASDGDDRIVGGSGHDFVSFLPHDVGVVVHLDTGVSSGWGEDELAELEGVIGTHKPDVVYADNGAEETILLKGGRDIVYGSTLWIRDDVIDGGAGIDTISNRFSTSGSVDLTVSRITNVEWLEGSPGNDVLIGDDGNNRIMGLGGDDEIRPGGGDDVLVGGPGRDTVSYGFMDGPVTVDVAARLAIGVGTDRLVSIKCVTGSDGDDLLIGGPLADCLDGGEGNDVLVGGGRSDVLIGGPHSDLLDGGPGRDFLYGDAPPGVVPRLGTLGPDYLVGGPGDDVLDGGGSISTFSDTASFETAPRGVVVDLLAGTAIGHGSDTVKRIDYVVGSRFDDEIILDWAVKPEADVGAYGWTGDDRLVCLRADVRPYFAPGAGDDQIESAGFGVVDYSDADVPLLIDLRSGTASGWGTDTFGSIDWAVGGAGDDTLYGFAFEGSGGARLAGLAGDDIIHGTERRDYLFGGDGDDLLYGYDGNDGLIGDAGADKLYGHAGNDDMWGDAGADYLYGDIGDDYLDGGTERDWGYAGAGTDYCVGIENWSSCETRKTADKRVPLEDLGERSREQVTPALLPPWSDRLPPGVRSALLTIIRIQTDGGVDG